MKDGVIEFVFVGKERIDGFALADLGDDEWRQMACVEACNILGDAVTLAPDAQHTMTATLTVSSLVS